MLRVRLRAGNLGEGLAAQMLEPMWRLAGQREASPTNKCLLAPCCF